MKIALFYPMNVFASWYTLGGYVQTLERLGHLVMNCPLMGNEVQNVEMVRMIFPRIEDLMGADVVLSMFHEYTTPWLEAIYGEEAWKALMEKVPVIARFDESMNRNDLGLPQRVPILMKWAHRSSFPAAQDAEKWGGQYLPFGVDTTMFNPRNEVEAEGGGTELAPAPEKVYDLAFIGSMYPMRIKYLQHLQKALPPGLVLRHAPVMAQDLSGPLKIASTQLLVENYRRIKIFFCLPPLSDLVVAKVVEVMACGTFIMYPELPGAAAKNMEIFEHGKHLLYYRGGFFRKHVTQIIHYLQHEDEREAIAKAGCELVHREYTLEQMLVKLLELKDHWQEDWPQQPGGRTDLRLVEPTESVVH